MLCAKQYQPEEVDYVCPDHGDEGILDVQYDYNFIAVQISKEVLAHSNDHSIWRYKPMLPVQSGAVLPSLSVGWTPQYYTPRLAKELDLRHVWVKDEGRQPTGSLKDRASAVAVVKAVEKGAGDHHHGQHRQRRSCPERIVRQHPQQPNVIFVPRKNAPGQNCPAAGIRIPRSAGQRHL